MARPTKQGIDYFPLDCALDDKIEMYLIEQGAVGFAVLICLWQMIYSNEGYYIDDSDDLHLLVKRKIDVGVNEVSDCINACLRRRIFSRDNHEKYNILTSKAIQKRYFDAAKKKKGVKVTVEYLLICVDSYQNLINSSLNLVPSGGNATNVNVEVKVKEEVKKKKKVTALFRPPDVMNVVNYALSKKLKIDAEQFIDFYQMKDWMVGKNKMKDWKAAVRNWCRRNNEGGQFNQSAQHNNGFNPGPELN